MKYEYEYKNDKYDIIAFSINERAKKQYTFNKEYGEDFDTTWIFNINKKILGINLCGNNSLDYYSVKVSDDIIYILTDFELYKINLDNLELIKFIDLSDYAPFDEIYEFNKGYILVGEMDIIYIENDEINWQYNSVTYIEYATVFKDNTIEVVEGEPYRKFILNKEGKLL
jgi:hypothetical protein